MLTLAAARSSQLAYVPPVQCVPGHEEDGVGCPRPLEQDEIVEKRTVAQALPEGKFTEQACSQCPSSLSVVY